MKNLFQFKKVFTIEEAAEHISKKTKVNFSKKDVYQLALDGEISISVRLQMKMAQEVWYKPPERYYVVPQSFDKLPSLIQSEVEGEDSSLGSKLTILSLIDTPKLIDQSKPVCLFKITGKPQEPISGYYKIEISKNPKMEAWMNSLCTDIPVLFMSLDGVIVSDNEGNYYQLIDRMKGQDTPCVNAPEESELRVTSDDLKAFFDKKVSHNNKSKPLDVRKEDSYKNTISALIDLLTRSENSSSPPYKNKEAIKNEILCRFEKKKGLSKSNIETIFGEITAHINKSNNIK